MNHQFALRLAFRFAFRSVVTLAICAFAQNSAVAQRQGRLTLSGRQRIPMRINTVKDGIWQITSPLFHGLANVQQSAIRAVHFEDVGKSDAADVFRFQMRSGEVLVGRFVSMDDKFCSIRHFDLGVVKIDSEQLVGATRVTKRQRVFTAADLPVPNCKARASNTGTMQLANGQRITSPFDVTADNAVSVAFRTRTDTDFRILLKAAGKTVTTVQVSADGVMAESADSLEFADLEIQPGIEELTFIVAKKQLSIRNRLGIEVLRQPFDCDEVPSLEIVNDSDRLEIVQTRVDTVRALVKTGEKQTGNIIVVDKDGESYACENVTVEDGRLTFAETRLSMGDVQSVHFRKRPFVKPRSPSAFALWADGSRMATSRFESSGSKLFVAIEGAAGKQLAEVSSPQAVFFADPGSQRSSVGNHKLMLGSSKYSGTFKWGSAKRPLHWQFNGFENPVALMTNRKIALSEFGDDRSIDVPTLDRLILTNGTILPCRVISIDKDDIHIKSPYCEAQKIPVDQFRACLFASHFGSGKVDSITTESIQRALTIPRFARDLEPEHVLMAVNGDLLRGTLVSITAKNVSFDSRAEPLRIDRQRISGIVRLKDGVDTGDKRKETVPDNSVAIDYGNDFVIVGELRGTDTELLIKIPDCGLCRLPKHGVKSLQVNADRTALSPLYRYVSWSSVASMDPRWSEPEAPGTDAAKTKGKPAPDFELTTLDGEPFRLSDHRGKVVVLDFWATWCKPCIMGMPGYLKAVKEFSEDEVVFAAVNLGETGSTVKKFQKKMQWDTHLLLDTQSKVAGQYMVNAIPHLVVIDRQGNVAEVSIGYHPDSASKLNQQIHKLLSTDTQEPVAVTPGASPIQ